MKPWCRYGRDEGEQLSARLGLAAENRDPTPAAAPPFPRRETLVGGACQMPQKPNVIAGSPGPLVPLKTKALNAYLRLDTWTLTEALFILNGKKPPGFESSSELMSHFMDAYHLAVNSIMSGNLCRKITVAGEWRFIESPTRWLSWAEMKNLHVAEAVRAKMMLAESADEKTDAPGGVEDRNDERPEHTQPYLAFMIRAAREMNMEPGTRIPKKNIEDWLRGNWPDQLGESTERKIKLMATFLRYPADEQGGYFNPNRDEKGVTP